MGFWMIHGMTDMQKILGWLFVLVCHHHTEKQTQKQLLLPLITGPLLNFEEPEISLCCQISFVISGQLTDGCWPLGMSCLQQFHLHALLCQCQRRAHLAQQTFGIACQT